MVHCAALVQLAVICWVEGQIYHVVDCFARTRDRNAPWRGDMKHG